MSGCGYTSTCMKCGAEMDCYADWKPYDISSAECLSCGFEYHTQEGQLTLEEVNSRRADQGLEPLKQLAKQIEEGGEPCQPSPVS